MIAVRLTMPTRGLTTDQRDHYANAGFLLLRRVFTSAEVEELAEDAG